MEVRFGNDPVAFIKMAEGFMRADPFSTSVIGVQASNVLAGRRPRGPEDLWVVAFDEGDVVGLAMRTPPLHLFVPRMRREVAHRLADTVAGLDRTLPGVNGEKAAVEAFAERWRELNDQVGSVDGPVRMYRLARLRPPAGVPGRARPAGKDDLDRVRAWFVAFQAEAHPQSLPRDVAYLAEVRLAAGEVTLWEDGGEPVSMAACSAPCYGVARVGPVYTPAEFRRHGYGAAVTAASTAGALDNGASYVVLYTDLANPTSNSVYQSIGYVKDHDGLERRFVYPGTGA